MHTTSDGLSDIRNYRHGGTAEVHPAVTYCCDECGRSLFAPVALRWTPIDELDEDTRDALRTLRPDAEGLFVQTVAEYLGCPDCKVLYAIELPHS